MSRTTPLVAVVDDDESVRRAVRRLVRSLGMDADTFGSGQELLDLLDAMPSYRPDCVVLDMRMPGLSGLEIQQRLSCSGLPVIFITGHDDLGVRERALAAGAVAVLRKPFSDEVFARALEAATRRRRDPEAERRHRRRPA